MLRFRCGPLFPSRLLCLVYGDPFIFLQVFSLSLAAGDDVDPSKPYAELWMGTHPSGPSTIRQTGEGLRQWLETHPEALGEKSIDRFGTDLPFLFKAS